MITRIDASRNPDSGVMTHQHSAIMVECAPAQAAVDTTIVAFQVPFPSSVRRGFAWVLGSYDDIPTLPIVLTIHLQHIITPFRRVYTETCQFPLQ